MSSFGEIVEPGTRTAWEDWDENIQEANRPKLMWQKELQIPDEIFTFYIFEDRTFSNGIKPLPRYLHELHNSIPEVNLKLYRSHDSQVYTCIIHDYNLLLASEITELLKPIIIVSRGVVGIITKPLVEYQAAECKGKQYVIRHLSTTSQLPESQPNELNLTKVPKLEQPNIVSGVTAGVINLREIMKKPGTAIVCYIEHNEENQVNELQRLLTHVNIGMDASQPGSVANSNLYI